MIYMRILASTKLYKNFQTAIPKEFRQHFDIDEDTIIEWGIDENGNPQVNFRKKVTLDDVIGIIEDGEKVSSVELKRRVYE